MTSTSVRTQLDEFTVGFDETVGPRLAAVFSGERDDLVAAGARAEPSPPATRSPPPPS